MGEGNRKSTAARTVLFVLIGFLGIGALAGGGMMAVMSSGEGLGMPDSMLNGAFGGSFRIPGIILFIVLGLYPLGVLYGLVTRSECRLADLLNVYRKRRHWSYAHALYVGFALLIWLTAQVYIMQAVAYIHLFYYVLGFAILIMAMLPSVQESYAVGE